MLLVLFVSNTYALFSTIAVVKDNVFRTGSVKIELNNNKKIFDENDVFIPGERISKTFTIKNLGTAPVYYKIFLENLDGTLSDCIIFNIYSNNSLLLTVSPGQLNENNPFLSQSALDSNQTDLYTIEAVLPEQTGNVYQDSYISFDFVAVAVQASNNGKAIFS